MSSASDRVFLAGGGEMGRLIRAHDWAATSLGPPEAWPQGLKTMVRMALTTRYPIFIFWGDQHICLYNDAYRASLGPEQHPGILGAQGQDAWAEVWQIIAPQIEMVRRGGSIWQENQLVPLLRGGALHDVYWTYSYSPIDEPTAPDGIGGVLVLCTETTDQIRAEQRRAANAARLRVMLGDTPGFVAILTGPDHVFDLTNAAYLQLVGRRDLVGKPLRTALPELAQQGYLDLLDQVYASGQAYAARRQTIALQRTPGAPAEEHVLDCVYQPIRDDEGKVTGIFCQGLDVTDSYRVETTLRMTHARQTLLLALVQRQRETADPETMMQAASEAVARHLGINRAGFMEVGEADRFTIGAYWSDQTLPGFSLNLPADLLGESYLAEVKRGQTIAISDNRHDPLTRGSALTQVDFRSSIGSPIFRAGRWRASMFVHHGPPRTWTEHEVALVRDVANQTWDAVERVAAVAALQENEAFSRLLLNSASEAFYSVDVDGTTTLCNAAFLAMLGFERKEDVIGRKLHDVIHHSHPDGSHYAVADCPIFRAAATGALAQVSDEVFFRADGTSFPVEYRVAPIVQNGRLRGAICTFVDITERRLAELALRELNETLEARVAERTAERDRLWLNSQDLLVVIDTSGIFRAVNPAATVILGWTPDEMVGRSVFDFIAPDDLAATAGALTTATERALPVFRNRYRHKAGGFRWISWVATPEGDLIYASGRHISAEVEAEAQLATAQDALRQAQKMEAVGQLTGGIAHDFNNMLAVVIGSLELLGRRVGVEDARTRRYVDAAMDGARRAAVLTQRLLAFGRQQPLNPEPIDPNSLVTGMSDLLTHALGGNIRFDVQLAPAAWPIEVDTNQLESVILNLAVNARDAMPGGGLLTIRTQNVQPGAAAAELQAGLPPGAFVLLAITDTGSGMAPEVVARAFDPFYTTKDVGKGTGLGLSQVYGFVKQSGGHVQILSAPGQGTTVQVYLPAFRGTSQPEAAALPVPDSVAPVRPERRRPAAVVLVVDDEPIVRQCSVDVLTELGYQVIEADGALAALRLLDIHADISLLFTDVLMPDINGGKLAEEARRRRPGLKVLFTTGYMRDPDGHEFMLGAGAVVLDKPFTVAQLAAKVRAVLDAAPMLNA